MNQTGGEPSAPLSVENVNASETDRDPTTSTQASAQSTGASNPAANVRAECLPESKPASEWRVYQKDGRYACIESDFFHVAFPIEGEVALSGIANVHNAQLAKRDKELQLIGGLLAQTVKERDEALKVTDALTAERDELKRDKESLCNALDVRTRERNELKARLEGQTDKPNAVASFLTDMNDHLKTLKPTDHAREAVCCVCNWTNVGCLNLGNPGQASVWMCHGCIKRMYDERKSAIDKATAEKDTLLKACEDSINVHIQMESDVRKERDQLKEEINNLRSVTTMDLEVMRECKQLLKTEDPREVKVELEELKSRVEWMLIIIKELRRPQPALSHIQDLRRGINELGSDNDRLRKENESFREAVKACEVCDGVTMEEVARLRKELEQLKVHNELEQLTDPVDALRQENASLKAQAESADIIIKEQANHITALEKDREATKALLEDFKKDLKIRGVYNHIRIEAVIERIDPALCILGGKEL